MRECSLFFNKKTGLLEVGCHKRHSDVLRDIGTLRWDPVSCCWVFGFTLYNVEMIMDVFDSVEIGDRTYVEIEKLVEREKFVREIIDWDEAKCGKDLLYDLGIQKFDVKTTEVCGVKGKLRDFQERGLSFLVNRGSGLICDEMGLGKTVEAIVYAQHLFNSGLVKSCLVVVLSSIKYNWKNEIEKFCDLSYEIIDGTSARRKVQWGSDTFFKVVGYETLISDLGLRKKPGSESKTEKVLNRKGFDLVICDEIHYIKNHRSARTLAVKSLESKYRIGLSGTPIDRDLMEMHSIMEFIYPGVFQGKSLFQKRFCLMDPFYKGKISGYHNLTEFRKRLRPYYLRRKKMDVAKDLPDKIFSVLNVQLSDRERRLYDRYKREFLESEDNSLAAVVRFKQICDSPELVGEDIVGSKLTVFLGLLDEIVLLNSNKVLLFSQYVRMCDILKREMGNRGYEVLYIHGGVESKERQNIVDEFNSNPSKKVLLCSEAGSHGLNIQSSDYVVHYDSSWSPGVMGQREDRAHRIGRKDVVNVISFVTLGTIEERVIKVLSEKRELLSDVIGDEEQVMNVLSLAEIRDMI